MLRKSHPPPGISAMSFGEKRRKKEDVKEKGRNER
jgi:hypothetical protein